ncbi:DNA-binding protein [Phascolarctobacterium faecium]|jgi:hypothetical protein|uniref:DNA-binding protein n=1 Tax=Phascolarctobacterium faecium TaxID=33025 RepID=UPI0025A3D510|nr:DNA-binding protein [Phascolarctobacterium faecium]MDM8109264.1 DNA-binding protein [Phascolarctobacterium faecium]
MENEKKWLNVHDVMAITGLSVAAAYKLMREVNAVQKADGKLTVTGKVSKKRFLEMIE